MAKTKFDRETVRRDVQKRIAAVLNRKKLDVKPEQIKEGVSLTTKLGIDSLDILQLTAALEKQYGIAIPEEALRSMDDLKGILKAVEKSWPS